MAEIAIKQGASLSLSAAFTNGDGSAVSLVGCGLLAQVRDENANWIADLVATVTNAAGGLVTLTAAPAVTAAWPIGVLRADLRVTDASGDVSFSDTFGVRVRAAISTGVPA